jgi:ligand-binding sensor domain-containing protein/two-component sensor histidine kinase
MLGNFNAQPILMRLTVIFYLTLLNVQWAKAQPASLYFENLTTQNGLSHNKVNCIIQDKRGFIWLGTNDGLNRYDGAHFTTYKNTPGRTSTISGNIITDIVEDKDEILWIATADGGLTKYDYRLEPSRQFKQFKNLPGDSTSIPVNIINKIVQDTSGYLWLATSGYYVLRFDKKNEKFISPVTKGTKTVLALTLRKPDQIWAGRQGGGILTINPVTLTFSMDPRYDDLYTKTLPHVTITSLFTDSKKNTWFGSWDRVLYKYDEQQHGEIAYRTGDSATSFINDDLLSFAESRNGLIWIGGRTTGLQIFNPQTNGFHNYQHDPSRGGSIADNQVNCIFIDKAGIVWLGTNLGVSISNPLQQQFRQQFVDHGEGESISLFDFYETENNELWIGSGKGIYIRRNNETSFVLKPLLFKGKELEVTKFYKSEAGQLFVGTNYSLFILDPRTFTLSLLKNTDKDSVINQIIKSHIVSIAESTYKGEPVLIASPYGHYLAYYFWSRQKWVSRLDTTMKIITSFNIRDNLVKKIYKSPRTGRLYIATSKSGIGIWGKNGEAKFTFYKNNPRLKDGLSNNDITDMIEDDHQNLWLTTYGGGLHYFNTTADTAHHIPESNNLLEAVQIDNNGKVWTISNGQLDKYDPVTRIYSSFQLPDIEKTSGVHGSIYKSRNGLFYLAGKNYFIEFNPMRTVESQPQLPVYITDFRIFNQSNNQLLNHERIKLPYNQNYITIEFAAPSFSNKTPVEFQYQLAGFNNAWIDLGTENKISFSNLTGGDYVFRVRATNRPGVWYEYKNELRITIVPPFYKTWWFYLLCLLMIAGITYGIYRYRINEILSRQAIRNKIAQDLHDSVGSTLSSIGVYSQVAKIYNEQNKNDMLKDALEKISETSGNMISEMSDIVWTINPRNDNMPVMLQRMESFAKPLLAAKNIQLHFEYDPGIESLALGMTQRKNFYLIFKEAVNNAVKYSSCLNLFVTIRVRNFRLEMLIRDDGAGCEMNRMNEHYRHSLSGNGLKNMSVRAREMKGSCEMFSSPGKGATVKLQFPIT